MSVSDEMTSAALTRAKAHVYDVTQLGGTITLIKPVTKDEMGEILTEDTLVLKSHPSRTSPFDRITLEKIAWAENVNMIFYVAKKQIDLLGVTIPELKQYLKVRFEDNDYELAYVDRTASFGTDCLYVIIGAKK